MKRLLSIYLIVTLALLSLPALAAGEKYPDEIESSVGRSFVFAPSKRGSWTSSDDSVAQVNGQGVINFLSEGEATILFTSRTGKESSLKVTVGPSGEMPPIIQEAIDLALQEWQEADDQPFPRSNKYTFWLRNAKSSFGWCGAFINYNMEAAGIPAKWRGESELLPDGRAHAVHEAAVPKLWESFKKMDRLGFIPRPGYEVIYGKRGSTPYVHIGLITDVVDLGDGLYEIKTVEGNMDSRILRYHYIYDAMAENPDRNCLPLPEDRRTEPDTFKYELHNKGAWYITAFGQTWY